MSSELTRATSGSGPDRSLKAAYWLLGVIAISELIAASVGLAPRFAAGLRKHGQGEEARAMRQDSNPRPKESATPASEKRTVPVSPTAVPESPASLTNSAPTFPAEPQPAPANDSTDRPFQTPAGDPASTDGAAIEILNAGLKGSDGGSRTLQLAIKSRSRNPVEVPQVKVQVYFYDEQNGEIVPSRAQVTSRWLSAPVDWHDGKPELLEVRYLPDTVDPSVRFAGYVVALYYKGDLQDCRSEPQKLRKLFEPKYFIGVDEP